MGERTSKMKFSSTFSKRLFIVVLCLIPSFAAENESIGKKLRGLQNDEVTRTVGNGNGDNGDKGNVANGNQGIIESTPIAQITAFVNDEYPMASLANNGYSLQQENQHADDTPNLMNDEYPIYPLINNGHPLQQGNQESGDTPSRRVIVRYLPGKKENMQYALFKMGDVEYHHDFDNLDTMVVSASEESIAAFENNPDVALVEDDPVIVFTSNFRIQQRMLPEQIPYGVDMVQAPEAWAAGYTGSGIKVCIIDSGIDGDHEDLIAIPKQGFSSSGESWNTDTCNHGTHVAGTIAAQRGNNRGVVGVAPGVDLYIVDVFDGSDCRWAFTSSIIDAAEKCYEAGAEVINMSLGCRCGTNCFSSFARDRFAELRNQGVLPIAAAGNCGNSETSYPAGYEAVVSVAAVDSNRDRASFSQINHDVELAAPGVGVLSTVNGNQYASFQGTSMASPHAAAVAALVWSSKPEATPDEIVQALRQSADDRGSAGRDTSFGYGIVQAMDAINLLTGGGGGDGRQGCTDVPGWYDSDGDFYNCAWYAMDNNCALHGNGFCNFGKTANQACCACGGGTCTGSITGWHDSDGPSYNCEWYSRGDRCSVYGDFYSNMGYTANQACCECKS